MSGPRHVFHPRETVDKGGPFMLYPRVGRCLQGPAKTGKACRTPRPPGLRTARSWRVCPLSYCSPDLSSHWTHFEVFEKSHHNTMATEDLHCSLFRQATATAVSKNTSVTTQSPSGQEPGAYRLHSSPGRAFDARAPHRCRRYACTG